LDLDDTGNSHRSNDYEWEQKRIPKRYLTEGFHAPLVGDLCESLHPVVGRMWSARVMQLATERN
jgi:hypothetical protein